MKTTPKKTNTTSMLAARLFGIRDLRLEQVPLPAVGPGEVLSRVVSVGICGSDVHDYLEGVGDQMILEPMIPGHELSAWMAEGSNSAGKLADGQLVVVEPAIPCRICESCQHGHPNLCPTVRFRGSPGVDGACAEYIAMPAENCFPVPKEIDADEGVLLQTLGIAIHSIDLANLKPGQTVAIFGAGPIGLLTAAVARAAGATEIYMTEPVPARRKFALDYIADTMIMKASTVRRKGLTIRLVRRMKHTYPRAIRLVKTGLVDVKPLVTHVYPLEHVVEGYETAALRADGVLKAIVHVGE